MFRRTADRVIDDAHNRIADAEMACAHAYTDADQAYYGRQLAEAQRYLARAVAARDAWDASAHHEQNNDEATYPYVPKTDAEILKLEQRGLFRE